MGYEEDIVPVIACSNRFRRIATSQRGPQSRSGFHRDHRDRQLRQRGRFFCVLSERHRGMSSVVAGGRSSEDDLQGVKSRDLDEMIRIDV